MEGCSKLRKFPAISTNIRTLNLSKTKVEDVPASIAMWPHLEYIYIRGNRKLKEITDLPVNLSWLDLRFSYIKKIPDCMKDFRQLRHLNLSGCMRLTSLPELPCSLSNVSAANCVSLETICFHLKHTPYAIISFLNNFKLSQKERQEIIQGSLFRGSVLLPGRQVPAEFDHRASGNSLYIPLSALSRFKICLVISPNLKKDKAHITSQVLWCRIYGKHDLYPFEEGLLVDEISEYRSEHLFIFHSRFLNAYTDRLNVRTEIRFEFINQPEAFHVIECDAKILSQPNIEGSYESGFYQASEEDTESDLSEDAFVDKTIDDCTNEEVTCDYGAKILIQASIEGSDESGLDQASEDDNEPELNEDTFVDETNIDDLKNEEDQSPQSEKHTNCWSWLFLCFGLSRLVRNLGR